MSYTCCEAGFNPEDNTYTIRMKDEYENVMQIPVESLEEFTEILTTFGRQKVVLNLRDRRWETTPLLS
jgi:hypothetical protein